MKKYLSLMLLCAAVFFTSCEKESRVDEIVGLYTYHETGYLTIDNKLIPWEHEGKFAVSKTGSTSFAIMGDLNKTGDIYSYDRIDISYDEADVTLDGITYHLINTYSKGRYSNGDHYLSWKTNATVTAFHQGKSLVGTLETTTSAKKQ